MAGDGQSEAQGTIVATTRSKVKRLADGSLFGFSGRTVDGKAVIKWLAEGGKKPKIDSKWTGLRLMPDGVLLYYTEELEPSDIDLPAATGSGMDFAIGAMEAGASPKRAVEIAAKRDVGTGGTITCLALKR